MDIEKGKYIIDYMVKNSNLIEKHGNLSLDPVIGEKLRKFGGKTFQGIDVTQKDANINRILGTIDSFSHPAFKNAAIFKKENLEILSEKAVAHVLSLCLTLKNWQKEAGDTSISNEKLTDLRTAREEYEGIITSLDEIVTTFSQVKDVNPNDLSSEQQKSEDELKLALKFMGREILPDENRPGKYKVKENANFGFKYKDAYGNVKTLTLEKDAAEAFCEKYLNIDPDKRPKISVDGVFKYFIKEQIGDKGDPESRQEANRIFNSSSTEWKAFKLSNGTEFIASEAINAATATYAKGIIDDLSESKVDLDFADADKLNSKFSQKGNNAKIIERLGYDMGTFYSQLSELSGNYTHIIDHKEKQFDDILAILESSIGILDKTKDAEKISKINQQIAEIKQSKDLYNSIKKAVEFAIDNYYPKYIKANPASDLSVQKAVVQLKQAITVKDGNVSLANGGVEWISSDYFLVCLSQYKRIPNNTLSKETSGADKTVDQNANEPVSTDGMLPDILEYFCEESLTMGAVSMASLFMKDCQYERLEYFLNQPIEPFKSLVEKFAEEKKNNPSLTGAAFVEKLKDETGITFDFEGMGKNALGSYAMVGEVLDARVNGVQTKGRTDVKKAYYYMDLVAKEIANAEGGVDGFEALPSEEKTKYVAKILEEKQKTNPVPTEADLQEAYNRWAPYHNLKANRVVNDDLKYALNDPEISDKTLPLNLSKGLEQIMLNNRQAIDNLTTEPKVDYKNLEPEMEDDFASAYTEPYKEVREKYGSLYPSEWPQNKINKMFKGFNVKVLLKLLQKMIDTLQKAKVITNMEEKFDKQKEIDLIKNGMFKDISDTKARGIVANQCIYVGLNTYLSTLEKSKDVDEAKKNKIPQMRKALDVMTNPNFQSDKTIKIENLSIDGKDDISVPDAMMRAYYAYACGGEANKAQARKLINSMVQAGVDQSLIDGLNDMFTEFTSEQLLVFMTTSCKNGTENFNVNYGDRIDDKMLHQFRMCTNINEVRAKINDYAELSKPIKEAVGKVLVDKDMAANKTTSDAPAQAPSQQGDTNGTGDSAQNNEESADNVSGEQGVDSKDASVQKGEISTENNPKKAREILEALVQTRTSLEDLTEEEVKIVRDNIDSLDEDSALIQLLDPKDQSQLKEWREEKLNPQQPNNGTKTFEESLADGEIPEGLTKEQIEAILNTGREM